MEAATTCWAAVSQRETVLTPSNLRVPFEFTHSGEPPPWPEREQFDRRRRPRGIAIAAVEHAELAAALTTEALYRRHAERVWRYCLHFLRRPADAEDAVQQTFLQAHRALTRGVVPACEAAWLLAIARNVCLTRAETQRRRGRAEVTEDPALLDVCESAAATDDDVSDAVRAAFARLPERQRHALFLREWQECSYAEIAAVLGTSESAVETLLVRARRTLARELAQLRRVGDLAGLLGWVRVALAPAAAKVALGAAVLAVAVVGTDAGTQAQYSRATPRVRVTRSLPSAVVPPVRAPARSARRARPASRRVVTQLRVRRVPVRVAPAVPPPVPAASPSPARPVPEPPASQRPAEQQRPGPAAAAPPTAAAAAVQDATGTVASTVDTVAHTAATAVPGAAPVVTTAAQTVSAAAQTIDSSAQTVTTTVSHLLPGP